MDTSPNQHIDHIVAILVAATGADYTIDQNPYSTALRFVVPATEKHPEMARVVMITVADASLRFELLFREMTSTGFATQTWTRRFSAVDPDSIADACHDARQALQGEIQDLKIPPTELEQRCTALNREWFIHEQVRVELYYVGGEYGDMWKYRLVHRDGTVICDHLNPDKADGHTYHLIVDAVANGFKRGVQEGQVRSVEVFTQHVAEVVFRNDGRRIWNFDTHIRRVLEEGRLRDKQVNN